MKSQLACVLRITDVGTRMTNCDVINIKNTIMTSEGTILLHLLESGIREIKRSPDTMKAAAILVNFELESKLDLHFDVKFDGECDGDGPES